ncbi:wax ester/triacylglycerol synthase family O-acyltransferase [Salinisphaera sp.]|uniref:WS/DGAT/MGAT family O-acyltransferase n=1 Tax=Salinisphaera sp. TaxID=1914330 RepID=UPI000C5C7A49|nr:wax ester/triacylglycerol synthase family O-acyltransferase [Salinisphaera sp.]MBS63647.1 wax ester/triacylglycerol synthase family O-acyltransferase [Salinisphaera sp.]
METKRLNLVDMAWLNVETENAPMQVGGLLTFQIPDGAPKDLPRRIVKHYHQFSQAYSPWNHRLRKGALRTVAPEWELLDEIDVEYHFRHSALPAPGGERELGELASRLHSHPLDFRRPPWEAHLIEGLEGNRFALYIKLHHSLLDGVAGMRQLARALTDDPNDTERPPFWALPPKKRRKRSPSEARPGLYRAVAELMGGAAEQVGSLPGFARVVRSMLKSARSETGTAGLPFSSASSLLNSRIQSQRRYATQLYSLAECRSLAHNAGVTVNDIVLTICGGALRRYLREIGELPSKPLTAGIPVSVRPADDQDEGNALTFIVANLATDIESTPERLQAVARSTKRAKNELSKLSAAAITQYTVALMAPYVLSLVTGMGGRTRPVFNVTVSNLPGPEGPLYIHGAEMEAFYPTSLVTHGQALNITVHGYGDTLGFGFIGCRETLPSMQRLAVYAGETLDELRETYGDREPAGKTEAADSDASSAKKSTAKRRSKTQQSSAAS